MRLLRNIMLSVLFFPALVTAQQGSGQQGSPCMPGMQMPGCPESSGQQAGDQQSSGEPSAKQGSGNQGMAGMKMGKTGLMSMQGMGPQSFVQAIAHHATSGTSAEPNSTPTPMLMANRGPWMLMFHANVFLTDLQQSSSRGGDKFFSTNWFMGMAQREAGPGVFTARVMLSLEPGTVTGRRYPLLFQQGETAFGVPIADERIASLIWSRFRVRYSPDYVKELLPAIGWTWHEHTWLPSEPKSIRSQLPAG